MAERISGAKCLMRASAPVFTHTGRPVEVVLQTCAWHGEVDSLWIPGILLVLLSVWYLIPEQSAQ